MAFRRPRSKSFAKMTARDNPALVRLSALRHLVAVVAMCRRTKPHLVLSVAMGAMRGKA